MTALNYDFPPFQLTHYTTIDGFMGILNSRCVRASNASFLNDRRELIHGLEAVKRIINKLVPKADSNEWAEAMQLAVSELVENGVPDTYVTCFTSGQDMLSQWRAYGGEKQGIAITFETDQLVDRLKRDNAFLMRVLYSDVSTKSKVRSELMAELEHEAKMAQIIGDQTDIKRRDSALRLVSKLLPRFKHLGFKEENEWRFVAQTEGKAAMAVKFRPGSNIIVPYIELGCHDSRLPINNVTIGPGRDAELTRKSVDLFLHAHGYDNVDVTLSKVPFRT